MPELPEVETIVRQLAHVLPGKVIASFDGVRGEIGGRRAERVGRKQKIIEIYLSGGLVMLVHLKMTGQLIFTSDVRRGRNTTSDVGKRIVGGHPSADWIGMLPSKHTRVTIHFTDGSTLYFNDQRKFGWVRLLERNEWIKIRNKMAPDVVDQAFTLEYFQKQLKRSRRAIKLVILDQEKIGGMGNIYACDALNLAGISPFIPSNQLKNDAVKKLHTAMVSVIKKGIETGGASLSHFVDTKGLGGHYQDHFLVYGREGEPCHTCHTKIEKVMLGGRGTYYCPKCQ